MTTVELRAAKIPRIGWIAVHCWFVVREDETETRWEIWQNRSVREPSWGHLHKNLMAPNRGVGNGDSWVIATWTDTEAQTLAHILKACPETYPHNYLYRYVPGPNSNTYVKWVLDRADVTFQTIPKAVGQYYRYVFGSWHKS